MANPDRELLDQIDRAWNERVRGGEGSDDLDADGFGKTIDALHQADLDTRPSDEFRHRLRRELLEGSASGVSSSQQNDFIFDAEEGATSQPGTGAGQNGGDTMTNRRWWLSHLGELAAMILILVVAIVAVAIWQSGGNSDGPSNQPGAAGDQDEAADEVAVPTPVQEGVWTDLTFERAQSITPFDLVMPDAIPNGYEIGPISVSEAGKPESDDEAVSPEGDPWMFAVIPLLEDPQSGSMIEVIQGNFRIPYPSMSIAQDGSFETPADAPYDENTYHTDLNVDGIRVSHMVRRMGDVSEQSLYAWGQDGLGMLVSTSSDVQPEDPFTPDDNAQSAELRPLVESIVLQRTSDEQPPPPPGTMTESETDSATGTDEPDRQPEIRRAISFEEAQERTPFDLVDPRAVQDLFDIGGVMLNELPSGDRVQATLNMQSEDGKAFEFIQEHAPSQPPGYVGDVEVSEPEDGTGDSSGAAQEEIEFDGLTVTRTGQANVAGDSKATWNNVIYNWNQDGIGMSVFAVTGSDDPATGAPTVTTEEIDAFVRAIVEARESDEAPEQPGEQGQSNAAVGESNPDSISLEEAREAVSFELADVSPLPGDLRPLHIEAVRYEDGSVVDPGHPDADNPNRVHLHLATMPDREPMQVVELIQSTAEIPNPEGEVIQVDGHELERLQGRQGQSLEFAYIWQVGEVNFGLLVTTIVEDDAVRSLSEVADPSPLVAEEDMAEFVRSTLQ